MSKSILWLTLGACALMLAGCNAAPTASNNQPNSAETTTSDVQPVLYNLGGVDLTNDVEFNQYSLDIASGKNVAVFLFGQPLPAHPGEPVRINPNIEFGGLKEPIELVAAIDGIVTFIKDQPDTDDYEVFLQTDENSEWIIGYDHVTDLQVARGQLVSVGDVLGKAAQENNGYYRYELQINRESANDTTMYCPTDLLDASVQADIQADLDTFVENWNTQYHAVFDNDAYATQSGGCLKPTVTNAESQGN